MDTVIRVPQTPYKTGPAALNHASPALGVHLDPKANTFAGPSSLGPKPSGLPSNGGFPGIRPHAPATPADLMTRTAFARHSPNTPEWARVSTPPAYHRVEQYDEPHCQPQVPPSPGIPPSVGPQVHRALPDSATRSVISLSASPSSPGKLYEVPVGAATGFAFARPGERIAPLPMGTPEGRHYSVGGYTDWPSTSQFFSDLAADSAMIMKEIVSELKDNKEALNASVAISNQLPNSMSGFYATFEVLVLTMLDYVLTKLLLILLMVSDTHKHLTSPAGISIRSPGS